MHKKCLMLELLKIKGWKVTSYKLAPNTFLALKVELAEFANEGRWFKHWSNDQEPRGEQDCKTCGGSGDMFTFKDCKECNGTGKTNKLLEEFVDAVHFFVSIANQKGWEDSLWVYEQQLDPDEFDGDLTSWFLEMDYFLSMAYIRKFTEEEEGKCKYAFGYLNNEYCFRTAWILFLNIGMNGFGFSWEQIEEAYFKKNEVNHKRQDAGY